MKPKVILHNATSLDGRMDHLSIDMGLFYGIASKWKEDATLVGSNTMLAAASEVPTENESAFEPPRIDPKDRRPLLVVPDSRGRIRFWHAARAWGFWRDVVVLCSGSTPKKYLDYLEKRHVRYVVAGGVKVDLRKALDILSRRFGVRTVRVDSGGTLNGALLRSGLVDEVNVLVTPTLVGGTSARSLFIAPDLGSAKGIVKLNLIQTKKLAGDVLWLRYDVVRKKRRSESGK
ncbi:RibD family protein [bacterium]|nr:RibD family protein [bacterium]